MAERDIDETPARSLPDSLWREVQNEYARAKRKHGEMTPDGTAHPALLAEALRDMRSRQRDGYEVCEETFAGAEAAFAGFADMMRLATLGEEYGEVARCLTYDQDRDNLRKELIQLGTMALAWASRLAR